MVLAVVILKSICHLSEIFHEYDNDIIQFQASCVNTHHPRVCDESVDDEAHMLVISVTGAFYKEENHFSSFEKTGDVTPVFVFRDDQQVCC